MLIDKITLFMRNYDSSYFSLLFIIFIQGMSSALPFGLVTSGIQSWYLTSDYNLMNIAWLSLVAQVYIFKFLWGNFCDNYCLFGSKKRKSWILSMQLIMIILIVALSIVDLKNDFNLVVLITILFGIASATQDLSIDAYRSDVIKKYQSQTKLISLLYIIGFRFGYLLSGAGILIVAHYKGWPFGYLFVGGLLAMCAFICLFIRENPNKATLRISQWHSIKTILTKEKIGLFFVMIFFYEFGDSVVMSILINYLSSEKNFSLLTLALQVKTTNIISLFISPLIILALTYYLRVSLTSILIFGLIGEAIVLYSLVYSTNSLHLLYWSQLFLGLFEGILGALIINIYAYLADGDGSAFNYSFIAAIGGIKAFVTPSLAIVIISFFSWKSLFILGALLSLPSCIVTIILRKELNKIF